MAGCDGAVADRRPRSAEVAALERNSQQKALEGRAGRAPDTQARLRCVPAAQTTHGWLGAREGDGEILTDHCSLQTGRIGASDLRNEGAGDAFIGRRVHEGLFSEEDGACDLRRSALRTAGWR